MRVQKLRESSPSRTARGATRATKSDQGQGNLGSYKTEIDRISASGLSDEQKDAAKYKIATDIVDSQIGTEQDLGDREYREAIDATYATMDPTSSGSEVRGENFASNLIRGAREGIDDFNNLVGGGIDSAWDLVVGDGLGGIAETVFDYFDAEEAGDLVKQGLKDVMTPELGSAISDIGVDLLLGTVGGPAGIGLALAKNGIQQSENIYEGISGYDDLTGRKLDDGQNLAKLGTAALAVGSSVIPAVGAMKNGGKIAKGATAAADDLAKGAATAGEKVADSLGALSKAKAAAGVTDDAAKGVLGLTADNAKGMARQLIDTNFTPDDLVDMSYDTLSNLDIDDYTALNKALHEAGDVGMSEETVGMLNALTEVNDARATQQIADSMLDSARAVQRKGERLAHGIGLDDIKSAYGTAKDVVAHPIQAARNAGSSIRTGIQSGLEDIGDKGLGQVISDFKAGVKVPAGKGADSVEAALKRYGEDVGSKAVAESLRDLGIGAKAADASGKVGKMAAFRKAHPIVGSLVPTTGELLGGLGRTARNIGGNVAATSLADAAEYGDDALNLIEMMDVMYQGGSSNDPDAKVNDSLALTKADQPQFSRYFIEPLLATMLLDPVASRTVSFSGKNRGLNDLYAGTGAMADYYGRTPYSREPSDYDVEGSIEDLLAYLEV